MEIAMPDSHPSTPQTIDAAYQSGRRVGLATAALALAIVSFLNLLGTEKSILAAVLAIMAMRGGATLKDGLQRSRIALAIAVLHILTVIIVLVLFRDDLAGLLMYLRNLS